MKTESLMLKTVYTAAEAEEGRIVAEWGWLSWKASAKAGRAEGITLGRVCSRKGCGNPKHSHNTTEEILYLMRGRLRHRFGDREFKREAGGTLRIPAGVYHDAESIGEEEADMIVAYPSASRDFNLAP
jgi:quercetin dioxygenase-like cupin family protein